MAAARHPSDPAPRTPGAPPAAALRHEGGTADWLRGHTWTDLARELARRDDLLDLRSDAAASGDALVGS